jgi:hypothetical protein
MSASRTAPRILTEAATIKYARKPNEEITIGADVAGEHFSAAMSVTHHRASCIKKIKSYNCEVTCPCTHAVVWLN